MEQKKATENLSQWFNLDDQKPWEPGVYEVEIKGYTRDKDSAYSFWDGMKFYQPCIIGFKHVEESKTWAVTSAHRIYKWRGLASDPSAKPKARGNRRVTRYVVRSYDKQKVFASFVNVDNARVYADSINEQVRITKIRFRTPEAT